MLHVMRSLFLVGMFVGLALAGDTPTAGGAVSEFLTAVIWPVLGSFAMALMSIVLNKVRTKYNVQISVEQEDRLRAWALDGIALAEEKAAAAMKRNLTKLTGNQKLDTAISYVLTMAPHLTHEQADALVHSTLGLSNAGASGSPV